MYLTAHAIKRCRQRRIPEYLLELALEIGTSEKKPGGATAVSIGKKDIDIAIHEFKGMIQCLERLKRQRVSIVMDEGSETVITAYRRNKPFHCAAVK